MADRYCTSCGNEFLENARFCTKCGQPRSDAMVPTGRSAARAGGFRWESYSPVLVVVAVFLVVGAAVGVGMLTPREAPKIVQRQGAPAAPPGLSEGEQAALPQDHPPLTIPAQVKTAIEELQVKADESPDDARTWLHLAEVLYRAGQIEKPFLERAKKSFAQVLKIDPTNLVAIRSLGNIAFDQEQAAEAIRHYEAFLKLDPDDLAVQTDLGTMYLAQGDNERAVRLYDGVLKVDPKFFQAQFNLAIAYRAAGQDEAALSTLAAARANAPDEATRAQIDTLLSRVQAPRAGVPGAESAQGVREADGHEGHDHGQQAAGFQQAIESLFRTHQILASKVQRLEWQGDAQLEATLTGFPMDQMPPAMRDLFLDRMKERIAKQKTTHGVDGEVRIDLVDFESGALMDTIVQ